MVVGDDDRRRACATTATAPRPSPSASRSTPSSVDAAYFEIVDLSETEDTLRALGISLLGARHLHDRRRRRPRLVGEPAGAAARSPT